MEGNGKSGSEKRGRTWDPFRPEEIHFPDDSGQQKKCVEILLGHDEPTVKLMILDEPTASLSDKETNLLFSIIRNLKAKGTAVLYVTHRLEEIMALTDRGNSAEKRRTGKYLRYCLYQPEGAGPADEREWGSG